MSVIVRRVIPSRVALDNSLTCILHNNRLELFHGSLIGARNPHASKFLKESRFAIVKLIQKDSYDFPYRKFPRVTRR
ncbi:Uncharacterized protein APZ42_013686 [Daphnia magna]|uniref:Uncharacterized protein n=1 Tax=Daphnia magna TaxID=35525 RepID=A0A162QR51_9CRUS|nr:Uncharacterized protein APZ42_013686 [Daphnia magna]